MKKNLYLLIALFFFLFQMVPLGAAEMVDNPLYHHWAKFKPGSFVILKVTTKMTSMNTEGEQTQTLKEITPQKAVVEYKMVTIVSGKRVETPATLTEIPAKIEKAKLGEYKVEYNPKVKILGRGEDTIPVKDKKVKAQWIKSYTEQSGMKMTVTVWTNDDIPGMTVKTISNTEGTATMTTNMIVLDFKAVRK